MYRYLIAVYRSISFIVFQKLSIALLRPGQCWRMGGSPEFLRRKFGKRWLPSIDSCVVDTGFMEKEQFTCQSQWRKIPSPNMNWCFVEILEPTKLEK